VISVRSYRAISFYKSLFRTASEQPAICSLGYEEQNAEWFPNDFVWGGEPIEIFSATGRVRNNTTTLTVSECGNYFSPMAMSLPWVRKKIVPSAIAGLAMQRSPRSRVDLTEN